MSETASSLLLQPQFMAASLRRRQFVFTDWGHVIPIEVPDWRVALTREYWGRNVEKLASGDTCEVHTADHRIRFEMLVLYANPASNPPTLELEFRPIHPPDLHLPAPERQRPPRFETRMASGTDFFLVYDTRTGGLVQDQPQPRNLALDLATSLNAAADAAEAETLAAEFARRHPAPEAPAVAAAVWPRPAAAEGALHVHPVGDGWELHGPGCAVVVAGLEDEQAAQRVLEALTPAPIAVRSR